MDALTIAVCDDVDIERELLERYVRQWAVQRNRKISVSSFSEGDALLKAFGEGRFDLVLLDIQMQGQDGMQVARRLRETGTDVGIFFVTGYDEYLAEGYEVEAFRYLLKPVQKQKLWDSFDKFAARREKKPRFWTLETPQGQRNVVLEEILYLESFGHTCRLYLSEDSFLVKMGITDMEEQLKALGVAVFRPPPLLSREYGRDHRC